MSTAYYIVLDRKNPGFNTLVCGKSLARETGGLEGLADSLGLDSLDSYVSISPDDAMAMAEEFRAMAEEVGGKVEGPLPEDLELPEERWFDPGEGVDYFSRLLDAVIAGAPGLKSPDRVAADLKDFKELLEKVRSIGARWHLLVDF